MICCLDKILNDLNKFENGKEIEYTIDEISNIDGYTTTYNSINKDGVNTIQITNEHTPERVKLAVEKEWDDNNNQDNKRVTEIQRPRGTGQIDSLARRNEFQKIIRHTDWI